MGRVLLLFNRDLGRSLNKRFILLLIFMVLFQSWFIIGSGSMDKIMEESNYAFMGIVFSFNILGSLVALALNFDSISKERTNKVMDLFLTSGFSKTQVISGKIAATVVSVILFSILYNLSISIVYLVFGSSMGIFTVIVRYILPVAAFILIYNLIGILFSIIFRSYKASFITSMAIGLLMMPRILETFVKGIAKVFGAGDAAIERMMMISPAVLMNSMTGLSGTGDVILSLLFLAVYLVIIITAIILVFNRQDELSYNN